MALAAARESSSMEKNDFYRRHYPHFLIGLIAMIGVLIIAMGVVVYQVLNRPIPQYSAVDPTNKNMVLTPFDQPDLVPSVILNWARKAATVSYTFDFVNYNKQVNAARPYFTNDGWQDYVGSVNALINTVVQGQLFVNGVVSGTPVISNQGPLPGRGYVWRVQIPFLVTYQSANFTTKRNFYVILSIVQVPTSINKQGIGIDQFVMV